MEGVEYPEGKGNYGLDFFAADERCAAEPQPKKKHLPRRRGDAEKTKSNSQSQNLNTRNFGGRGELNAKGPKGKKFSRIGQNLIVSNADKEIRPRINAKHANHAQAVKCKMGLAKLAV